MKNSMILFVMLVVICGIFGVAGCDSKEDWMMSASEKARVKQMNLFFENEKQIGLEGGTYRFEFEGRNYAGSSFSLLDTSDIYFFETDNRLTHNLFITSDKFGKVSVCYKENDVSDPAVLKNAEVLFDKLLVGILSIQKEQLSSEQKARDNALMTAGLLKIEEEKLSEASASEPNQKGPETSKKNSSDDGDDTLLWLLVTGCL